MISKTGENEMDSMMKIHSEFQRLLPEPENPLDHIHWLDKKNQYWQAHLAGKDLSKFYLRLFERRTGEIRKT